MQAVGTSTIRLVPSSIRTLIVCAAIALLVWSLADSQFRDHEGVITPLVCLPLAAGVSLILIGLAFGRSLAGSAAWLGLMIIGNAASLQLIEAGPFLRYQHYKPLMRLLNEVHPLLLAILGIQFVLVALGLVYSRAGVWSWLRQHFKTWQLLTLLCIFVFTSATVSRSYSTYVAELGFAAFIQSVNLGNLILFATSLPNTFVSACSRKLRDWFGQSDGEPSRVMLPKILPLLAAVWVTTVAAALNHYVYQRHPHILDEVSYVYHARYFAEGRLAMPAPPEPKAFDLALMYYDDGRWFSPFPPGWPMMLALGVKFGVGWLVNPLLAGFNVLLCYALAGKLYGRRTAQITVALLCVSPWHVFMAMSFMSHTFGLTCTLVAGLAVVYARAASSLRECFWAGVAGTAAGFVGLIRPLEGLIIGGLFGLWIAFPSGRGIRFASAAVFASGLLALACLELGYNTALMGKPNSFPVMAYFDKYYGPGTNAIGFGADRGVGWAIDPLPGHSPFDALVNANLNTFSVNIELFGWAFGSVGLIALLIVSGRMTTVDHMILVLISAVVGVYSLYWFSGGPDFGARYWYPTLVPCVLLTVRGAQWLCSRLESLPNSFGDNSFRFVAALVVSCLITLVNYFPWRSVDKYYEYLGMRPDIRNLMDEYDFDRGLVLVRGERFPDYSSAAVYNPVDLYADEPIFAWDRSAETTSNVIAAFPRRPVWHVNGPTVTGTGFEVVAGPTSVEAQADGESTFPDAGLDLPVALKRDPADSTQVESGSRLLPNVQR